MYRYIIRYKRMNAGDSPTRREIAAAIELPAISTVQHHLDALERRGLILRPRRGQARRIAIPGARWEFDETDTNKCAMCGNGDAADLLEEERKVRERSGENEGVSQSWRGE